MRTAKTLAAIAAVASLGLVQPAMAATAPAKARPEMSAKHHRLANAKKVTATTVTTTKTKTKK